MFCNRLALRVCLCVALVLLASLTVFAQYGKIDTVAGSGPGAGLQSFGKSVADSAGNIYVTDGLANRVVKVTNPTSGSPGFVTIAGTGVPGWSGDNGPAINAQLKSPCGVALDVAEANLYIADVCGDPTNGRVRKVELTGAKNITLVNSGFNPRSIAVDNTNTVLVAASNRIYKVTPTAVTQIYINTSAPANWKPYALAVDRAVPNTVFFAGSNLGSAVYVRIAYSGGDADVSGSAVKIAGNGNTCPTSPCWDGSAVAPAAAYIDLATILYASGGQLYFASALDNRYGRFNEDGSGTLQLIAGSGANATTGDGALATNAGIANGNYWGLAVHNNGGNMNVFISGPIQTAQVMRWFPVGGNINSVATPGNPNYQGDGGAATSATISNNIQKTAFDAAGNMYIADQANRAVRKVTGTTMSTAITGVQLDAGLAAGVHVGNFNIANDAAGNIYVVTDVNGIFKYAAGTLSHPVGYTGQNFRDIAIDSINGFAYVVANSQVDQRQLSAPTLAMSQAGYYFSGNSIMSVAVDKLGQLWVTEADTGTNVWVKQVKPAGTTTTLTNIGATVVANYPVTGSPLGGVVYMDNFTLKNSSGTTIGGLAGSNGFAGDGAQVGGATRFSSALGLSFDSWCHLYVSDSQNQRVRRIDNQISATVNSNQPGISYTVDAVAGGGTFAWVSGSSHTLATTTPQNDGSPTRYVFSRWLLPSGNDTNLSVAVTAPNCANQTPSYQAQFTEQHTLTLATSPGGDGTVTPASGSYYDHGSVVALQATPAANRMFLKWTGATVANANSASTSITLNAPETVTANFFTPVPPVISASFDAATAVVNAPVNLTFTVVNPNPLADSGVSFINDLPGGMVVASPASASNTCGGVLTATAGASTITLAGGQNAANSNCTVIVRVVGTTSGLKTNVSGAVNSTPYGTGNTASAIITVLAPPSITTWFGPASIAYKETTTVGFVIKNEDTATTATGLAFTNNLPAGLVVDSTPGVANTCAGTVTAIPATGTIALSGASLAPGQSCSIVVNVTATAAGPKSNSVSVTSTTTGTSTVATATLTVTKGVPVITWSNPADITYGTALSGTELNASRAYLGSAVPGTLTYTPPSGTVLSAGANQTLSVQFVPTDLLNYDPPAPKTVSINVAKATPVVTWSNPADITYGTPLGAAHLNATFTAVVNGATVTVPGTPTYTPVIGTILNAGVAQNLTVNFVPTDTANYNSASKTVTINVTKANPVIAWSNPADITYGTALSATQLNATYSAVINGSSVAVPGTATYTPAIGALLNAGNAQDLTVSFVPTDAVNFNSSSLTVKINVAKATPTATWANPASISLGTPLSATQLNATFTAVVNGATVTVAGTPTYNPAIATVLAAGAGQNLTVDFAPTDTTNYNPVSKSVTITVVAPPSIFASFALASIPLNTSTSLTYTITNPNTGASLTGVGFTNMLPGGLKLSSTNVVVGSCGGGVIDAIADGNYVTLSNATLAPNASCTFSVSVTGTTAGMKINTTGNVSSTEGGTGNVNTSNISVLAPPSIAAVFTPATIALNGTSSLTFTITNPAANAGQLVNVGFANTLPAGLSVANVSAPACFGTMTTTAPNGIALSGAVIDTTTPCQFSVTVTGAASGTHTNTTGAVNSPNGGTGNTASATLTVASPPSITAVFGAGSVPLSGGTSLTFTINNPNSGIALNGIAFTDNLPAGLVVSSTPNLSSTCTVGTATAIGGSSSVSLSGGTLAASASCTVSVDVVGVTAGVKYNSVQVTSTEGGAGNTSNSQITVVSPPVITTAFGAASIPLNGTTSLSFTIQNNNTLTILTNVGFVDTLPAGLVIATPNGLTSNCPMGTIAATPGTNVVSLTGERLTESSSCTLSVNVNGIAAGLQNNTTGPVSSALGGNGSAASASLLVVAPPTLAMQFLPTHAALNANGASGLYITIRNPGINTVALTGVGFTNTLPAGLSVGNGTISYCGGTLTLTSPSSISFSGATIAPNGFCDFAVGITGTASGSYTSTMSVNSANGGTSNAVTANLTIASPPVISGAFMPNPIPLNGSTTLSISMSNPAANPMPLTGIGFTNNLPAGVVLASTPNVSNTCGGTVLAVAGSSAWSLSGGTLAVGGSCTISVEMTGTTAGQYINNVQVDSAEGGSAVGLIPVLGVIAPPSLTAAFLAPTIPLNLSSTYLNFTIANPNTSWSLNGVGFTNVLPAGLVVANTAPDWGGTCGGTLTAVAGSNTITLSGAVVPVSASCSFAVEVKGIAAGVQTNTTGPITSAEGGTGATASASIVVLAPPLSAQAFGAANIPLNGSTSLSITLTNPDVNTLALDGVAFTDNLPTGLAVSTPSNIANTCGGTATAVDGSRVVALGGATLPVGASCTVTVSVTGTQSGLFTNTVRPTSMNGGPGVPTTAQLAVAEAPMVEVRFAAPTVPLNQPFPLTLTLYNAPRNRIPLTGVSLTDSLPAGLVLNTPSDLYNLGCGGTATAPDGGSTITLTGGTLPVMGTCRIMVGVVGTTAGIKINSASASAAESGSGSTTASDTMTVIAPPAISAAFGAATIQLRSSTSLSFTIVNPNTTADLLGVRFVDTLPAGLVISSPNGLTGSCGSGAIVAVPGSNAVDLSGATIAPNASCTFSIDVTGIASGNQVNSTGSVISQNGGMGNAATATLTVLAPDLTVAVSHPGNFRQGDTGDAYSIVVANTGAAPTFGTVTVVDSLPAGLTATAISGTGWTCTLATLTCTRNDVLAIGASYPVINLTVNVAANAAPTVTNAVAVSGGSESDTTNNAAVDVTTVIQVADLAVSATHTGNFIQTQRGAAYSIVVTNVGPGPTVGSVTVTDVLPAGFTSKTATGTGWACTVAQTTTCSRSDLLAEGASYPAITLTVDVAATAAASITNTVTIAGGGELNTTNNSSADVTTVVAPTITIVGNTTTATLKPGQTATFNLTLTTNGNLTSPVTFACSGLPALSQCSFSPAGPTISGTPTAVTMTIVTTGVFATNTQQPMRNSGLGYALAMALPMMVFAAPLAGAKCKRSRRLALLILLGLLALTAIVGCGSPRVPTTPSGTYAVTVTASSAPGQGTAVMNITVQ